MWLHQHLFPCLGSWAFGWGALRAHKKLPCHIALWHWQMLELLPVSLLAWDHRWGSCHAFK